MLDSAAIAASQDIIRQNVALALLSVVFTTIPTVAGFLPLWLAVTLHEGSTLMVALNSLRLLMDVGAGPSAPAPAFTNGRIAPLSSTGSPEQQQDSKVQRSGAGLDEPELGALYEDGHDQVFGDCDYGHPDFDPEQNECGVHGHPAQIMQGNDNASVAVSISAAGKKNV